MAWNSSEIARNNIFNSENRAYWQVRRFRMKRFVTESKLLQCHVIRRRCHEQHPALCDKPSIPTASPLTSNVNIIVIVIVIIIIISCSLSHCYSISWDIIRSHVSSLRVCLSVCLFDRALRVAIFINFDETGANLWSLKERFRCGGGAKSNKRFPYFTVFSPNCYQIMHFQWKGWNTSLMLSVEIAVHSLKHVSHQPLNVNRG